PALAADLDIEPAKEYVEVCPNSGFRGAILLPGTGICFKVGGYAKADFIFTFDDFAGPATATGVSGGELLFDPNTLGGVGGDRSVFHARQSRINFDARTTTDLGSARAFIEWDLFNTAGTETFSNSANPRLRHAFVELGIDSLGGSLLAGQTWGTFGDLGSYANTLDFNGPNAQTFTRQAQIRWTQPITESTTIQVAAENPDFANEGDAGAGFDAVPDFVIALKNRNAFGNFHLSGVFRYLDPDQGAGAVIDDEAFGYGVQFAGTINVGDKDKFRFQVNFGDGIGRYIQQGGAAAIGVGTDLETLQQFGVIGSYQHFWSDKLQSNLVGGYYSNFDTGLTGVGSVDDQIYAAVNLIYSPRGNVNLGIEGLYGRNNLVGIADSDDAFRVQTSVQFSF
ncbi:MAG: DcaP family trimeric outer membrane transporter, partial [Pseudomonadota bacterium]